MILLVLTVAGALRTAPLPTLRASVPAVHSRAGLPTAAVASGVRCDDLIRTLFSNGVSASAVAAACSDSVEWVDMGLPKGSPLRGPAAVQDHLTALYPAGSKLVVEKLSDGALSGGFSWHREAEGAEGTGLRGITYIELDEVGKINYVQEGYEPLFKLGTLLEVIFKLAAKADKSEKDDTKAKGYESATPTDAPGIIRYLWEVAYPGGAEPTEALRFFSDDCVYEDFNYPKPFVGINQITEYINLIPELPNVIFELGRCSEGSARCCYTWKVKVNGQDGPSGISFKEVDTKTGKVTFNRDIPAPEWPRPLGRLAGAVRPKLRTFRSRGGEPSMRAPTPAAEAPSVLETVTSRVPRAAMALTWIAFSAYVAAFSPGDFAAPGDTELIMKAIDDPSSMNPIFFAVFNALGVLPGVNAALLLPGSKEQRPLPTVPFVASAFALGFGAIGPYLAVREPRPEPIARSELGFFSRYVTESRLYGAGLVAASLILINILLNIGDVSAATADFAELFASSKLVHVSTIDFAILSIFAFDPIREDMARRGWWDEDAAQVDNTQLLRLLAFVAVPVLGPCAYLVARPALSEE